MEAIRDEIETQLGLEGVNLLHEERGRDSGWLLMDFGEVVVHIFEPEQREYYGLDRVWDKAVPILRIL